jgi:hypothetical protein
MNRLVGITCSLLLATFIAATAQRPATISGTAGTGAIFERQRPLFIENRGQWDRRARYLLRAPGLDLWLADNEVIYDLHSLLLSGRKENMPAPEAESRHRVGHVVRMKFLGAASGAAARGIDRKEGVCNYFIGNDPSHWASDIPLYAEARLDRLYDGIDAAFYLDGGTPRYDLIIAPGADPGRVAIGFEGAERVRVDEEGTLVIGTSRGELKQGGLFAYQIIDGSRRKVGCAFTTRKDGMVGFSVGEYDRSVPLVIDPLVYSTLVGGSGQDICNGMAVDASGNVYLTGYTQSGTYPTATGAYDIQINGDDDLFVTKLNSSGTALLYSTYIGGSNRDDGWGIAIDGSGNACLTGETVSTDFPTTTGAYDRSHNGSSDIFVTKLNSSGTALLYSTFIGGANADVGRGIAVDGSGNAYVGGETSSTTFPATAGAYDASFNGITDAFIAKLNSSGSGLLYATFIGGGGLDRASSIAIDGSGNAYITGSAYTSSVQYPTTTGAYDEVHNGGSDVFVTKLNSSGSALGYSTFLGSSGNEEGLGITVDGNGSAYLTGHTASVGFPTQSAIDGSHNGNDDVFITGMNPAGNALLYSTFVGGPSYDYGNAIAIDGVGNVYVTGSASGGFPTTSDAYDRTYHDSNDVFLLKINAAGSSMLYSTLMGGRYMDHASAVGVDGSGNVHIAGYTYSDNFPTTAGAYSQTGSGSYDLFAASFSLGGVSGSITLISPNGGESWCAGSAQAINWTSSGISSGTVRIELSQDGGVTWPVTIASGVQAGIGSYAWTIPLTLTEGSSYKVRLIANSGFPNDTGNGNFTINVPPQITLQPGDQERCPGDTATFVVAANGTGLRFQWRRNGTPINGANAPVYSKVGLGSSDSGSYDVIVSGACAPADTSSRARLIFNPPVAITSQPQSQDVCPGEKVTLRLHATGKFLSVAWRKNGTIIPTGVDSSFVISSAAFADSGRYDAIVSGICGPPDTSVVAVVRVIPNTSIVEQPTKFAQLNAGDSIRLHVSARGGSLSYQWRKDGKSIPGATDSVYMLHVSGQFDSGLYDVIVIGACGPAVTSDTATITVAPSSDVPGSVARSGGASLTVIPNPANGSTRLIVELPDGVRPDRDSRLELFDLQGNRVLDLTGSFSGSGWRSAEFDAHLLPSGLYHCRLTVSQWSGTIGAVMIAK